MQDVDQFLVRKGITLGGYLDPSRPAVLEPSHMARVNYETYFFADAGGRERFLEAPLHYCGWVTDPVTKSRFRPSATSLSSSWNDVLYYFSSHASYRAFQESPQRHVLPGYRM